MAGLVSELSRLFRHSAIYGFSIVLGKAIGFLLIPLYTHYILPTDYGTLELLDLSVDVIGMFVGLGIVSAVARFYSASQDENGKKKVVSTALIALIVLVFTVIFLLFQFVADNIAELVLGNIHLTRYVQISLCTFAFNAILEIPLIYLRIQERSIAFGVIALSRLALSLTLNVYFIVVLGLGIVGILYSGLIVSCLFSLLLMGWCVKDVGIRFDGKLAWSMILFGAPLILNSVGMFIVHFGDRFLLKASASLATVGVYSLAYKIGMGLITYVISQPFLLIWSVRCYELVNEEGGLEKYGKIFSIYTLLLLSMWLTLTAFSSELVYFMAPVEYREACLMIPIISLGYVLRSVSEFFRTSFLIAYKTSLAGWITVAVAVYCLVNYFVLIPKYQAIGAALATLSTFMFMVSLNGYFAFKVLPVNYRLTRFLLSLGVFIPAGIGCFLLNEEQPMFTVALVKACIVMLSCLLSFVCIFDAYEREHAFVIFKKATLKSVSLIGIKSSRP